MEQIRMRWHLPDDQTRTVDACAAKTPSATARPPLSSRLRSVALAALTGATLLAAPALEAQTVNKRPSFAPGRVLVEPKAGVSDAQFQQVISAIGGRSAGKLRGLHTHVVNLPQGLSEEQTAARLARHPMVKFAELDVLLPPGATTTNDPLLPNQWHLSKIAANTAWDKSTGSGTVIAILDTGVDGSHPDLAAQLVPGWNFYDNNSDTSDIHGHGTAVAGTAAAVGNNSTGIASVSWTSRIMPVRISKPDGYASYSTIAQGLTWAVDSGARVANISYAVSSSSTVRSAADKMRSKGGVVVVSAGNSGGDTGGSASDSLIVVSATNSSDTRTSWSSYGADVDISAPGEGIYTTTRGGGYGHWNGTSFSSPVVAGTAALIKSLRPDFTAAQIESTLFATAKDLGSAGKDPYYGNGRVDAAAAIAAVGSTPADTTSPTAAVTSPSDGATVSGLVTVGADAKDNVGVTRVDLMVNGSLVGSDSASPFSFAWDSSKVSDGSVTLTAVAYDNAGNSGMSAPVAVKVSNQVTSSDTTPPTVAILSPSDGAKVSGTVTISASAADNSGLAWVQLSIDGAVVASGTSGSLNYKWNTRKVKSGAHAIAVTAKDNAGNTASGSITVYR
jgi:subtilisin family serine protease